MNEQNRSSLEYLFRLRYLTAGLNLRHEGGSAELEVEGLPSPLTLKAWDSDSIADAEELVLRASGFESEAEATEAGSLVRAAVLWSAVKVRYGVDLGDDRPVMFRSDGGGASNSVVSGGQRSVGDVHGLMTTPSDAPLKFWRMGSVGLSSPLQVDEFKSHVQEVVAGEVSFNDKEALSAELFAFSRFEHSVRARYLTLWLAVEVLLPESAKKTSQVTEVVDALMDQVNEAPLSDGQRQSLKSALGALRNKSIGTKAEEIAEERLGSEEYGNRNATDFVSHCYDVRNDIAHTGTPATSKDVNLRSLNAQLELFVSDLLATVISD